MESNDKQVIFEYIITDNDHKNLTNSKYAFSFFNQSLEHLNKKFKELEQENFLLKINFQEEEKPNFFIISNSDKDALLAFRTVQLLSTSISSFFLHKNRNIEFYGNIQGYRTKIFIDNNNHEIVYNKSNLSIIPKRNFQIKKNIITKIDGTKVFNII